jgi:hypothetical protein
VAEQGSPPPRSGRLPTAGRRGESRGPGRRYWDEPDGTDEEEYPPWAGPGVTPRWADQEARRRREHARPEAPGRTVPEAAGDARGRAAARQDQDTGRPGRAAEPGPGWRSRRAAARSRRRSRITWVWGVAALLVVAIVTSLLFLRGQHQAAPVSSDGFVTTFRHGEFKTVPNACTAVTSTTLNQYLPGKRRMVAPHSLNGGAQSLCNWTLDAPPLYRVLEVNVQAYSPSGLATGNGSATNAAIDAYQQDLQALRHPARATHLPPATVIALHGLGSTGFAALQIVRARGLSTDLETVFARDRNVVVTVVVQGPHAGGRKYHAAPQSELQSGAIATATDLTRALH